MPFTMGMNDTEKTQRRLLLDMKASLTLVHTSLCASEVTFETVTHHIDTVGEWSEDMASDQDSGSMICTQGYNIQNNALEGAGDLWVTNERGEGVVMALTELDEFLKNHFASKITTQ